MAAASSLCLLRPARTLLGLAGRTRPVFQRSRLHLTAARLTIQRPPEETGSVPPEWDGVIYRDKRGWFGEWLVGTPLLGEEQHGEYVYKSAEESLERARIQQQLEDYYFGDPPRDAPWEFWKYCMEFLIRCDDEHGVRTMLKTWEWEDGQNHSYGEDTEFQKVVEAYLERKRQERWYL